MNKKYNFTLPLLFAITIIVGMLVGTQFNHSKKTTNNETLNKLNEVFVHIDKSYIDTVDQENLIENAIREVVYELDPHSYYISKKELEGINQDLQGDFEGIGVEFNILKDTIIVVSPIAGGPSHALGIMAGDRIITIDDENVAGIGISTTDVRSKLLGKKGTKVNVEILRRGENKLLDFNITRDKIPLYSVDASYMIDNKIGYIKINRFSAKTTNEFLEALKKLQKQGMQDMILDLTGNPGGYLNAAFVIADQFFGSKKLIVYTEGRSRPRKDYFSSSKGFFKTGKLVILMDEGSASASEIVAGAVQDWDRGLIIGRRSYGKGLVQEQMDLNDKSALRLTVAKYYTPSGRYIQKPYKGANKSKYYLDVYHRFTNGEMNSKDSIKFPDSLKYKTNAGRIVYGGGGIMPDIFVPIDTSKSSNYLSQILRNGLIYRYVLQKTDENRDLWNQKYNSYNNFKNFPINNYLNDFVKFASKNGVPQNDHEIEISKQLILVQIKALIARQLYGESEFYKELNNINEEYIKALEVLQNGNYEDFDLLSMKNKQESE